MTFCLAFARPTFALLAGDTRTLTRDVPVDAGDLAALPVTIQDGGDRKLARLRGGWMTGGPLLWWSQQAEAVLAGVDVRDRVALLSALQAFGAGAMRELEASAPPVVAADTRNRTTLLVIRPAGDCFETVGVNWAGDELAPGMHPFKLLAGWPDGIPAPDARALAADFQATLEPARGLLAAIRATAALFRDVARRCGPTGSVSDQVEIGALTRTPAGRVLRRHLAPVTLEPGLSDRELGQLLETEAA